MPIVRKRHIKGINLDPISLTAEDLDKLGDLAIDSDDNRLKYRNNAETKEVVNLDENQVLSNKTLDNTNIVNYENLAIGTIDPLQKDMAAVDNVADALDAIRVLIDDQNEASEIEYNPALNPETTALNVQDALDDTGIASQAAQDAADAAQADIDAHIDPNNVLAHTGANIRLAPFINIGGELRQNVQTALVALNIEVEDRALADMGTITNATIQDASIETPIRLDVKQDILTNLETYATTASDGQIVFATDEKKMFQVIDNALEPIGAGGATQFEIDQASHGFVVGDGIYHDSVSDSWVKAQADDANTLATYVVVESLTDKFVAADFGRLEVNLLTNPDSLAAGEVYYLSDSVAGQPTTSEFGLFSNPLFYVESVDATDINNQLATLQIKVYRPEKLEADEEFSEIEQSIVNTGVDVDITGLIFNKSVHRAISLAYSLYRTSDLEELSQVGQLRVTYKPTAGTFSLSDDFGGDDAGVDFSIDAVTGQISYTSSTVSGTYDAVASKLKIRGSEVFRQ